MAAQEALLSLSSVHIHFGGVAALAIEQMHLPRRSGIIAVIMGPNGAGKTTLLNAVTGYVPVPRPGSITLCTTATTELARREPASIVRLGVARTFQSPSVFPQLRVREVFRVAVSFAQGIRFTRAIRSAGLAITTETIKRLALSPDMYTSELTLPFARRLELGRALLTGPRVLMLDEPTAGLPEDEKRWFLEFLRGDLPALASMTYRAGLSRFKEIAIVLVTHDMTFLHSLKVAGLLEQAEVLFMRLGQVTTAGTFDSVLSDPTVREGYLGF